MTALADLLAACLQVQSDRNAARSTKAMATALGKWAGSVDTPTPTTSPEPTPAPVFGAKIAALLPRQPRPATVKQVALGASLTNLLNGTPTTGGIVYQLQPGAWGPQVLPKRVFDAPVWLEPASGGTVSFTNPNGHALYIDGTGGIVLADFVAEGASNTGVKIDSGATDIEMIRAVITGNKNQGLLCASTTARIALWDFTATGNGSTGYAGTRLNQCHNVYIGDCDTFLACNLLSTDAAYGSCLQLGGAVRHWRVCNATLDDAPSVNGACLDLYTMSTQTPQNEDGLLVNSILTRSGYFGAIGSGTNPDAASQVIRQALSYGHKAGDFAPGGQFVLGDGLIVDADPLYMGDGDYRLQAGSPARGVGDPDWMPPTDHEGTPRTVPTLGAFA